jgi:hypothetical protein
VSASIDWAREIRGTSSMANAVTRASRSAATVSGSAQLLRRLDLRLDEAPGDNRRYRPPTPRPRAVP